MRAMSVAGQRYQAVLAVISEGATVTEVAARIGVSRQSVRANQPGRHTDHQHKPRPAEIAGRVDCSAERVRP